MYIAADTLTLILRFVCWALAAYLFVAAHFTVGQPINWDWFNLPPLLLSIFLFLLPFAQTIKFGGLFSFDAKIDHIKEEVDSFKAETRHILTAQTSMITNVSQHTIVNLPSLIEAYKAEEKIEDNANESELVRPSEAEIAEYMSRGLTDPNLALVILRTDLEKEFRRILRKRTKLGRKTNPKLMSLRGLWREFFEMFPTKVYMKDGLQYVADISNAASHGQKLPTEHAQEALSMGFRILGELKSVPTPTETKNGD